MRKKIFIFFIIIFIPACDRVFDVNYPDVDPGGFLTQTYPVSEISKIIMEGVYSVTEGNENLEIMLYSSGVEIIFQFFPVSMFLI
jgi:hypothetical protein